MSNRFWHDKAMLTTRLASFYRFWGIRLVATLLGVLYISLDWQPVIAPDDPLIARKALYIITGRVVDLPKKTPGRYQFLFSVTDLHPVQTPASQTPVSKGPSAKALLSKQTKQIRVNWYQPPDDVEIMAGQQWRLQVRFKPPRGLVNVGSSDYELWLYSKRIELFAIVQNHPAPELLQQEGFSLLTVRQKLSQVLLARLQAMAARFEVDASVSRALLPALLVGDRQHMLTPHWEVLSRTGTQHLMAISGLHIGLVALLGYGLALLIVKRFVRLLHWWPAQHWAALVSIGFALFYATLAGFSVPTQRALWMVFWAVLANIMRRHWSLWQVLGLTMGVMLIGDSRMLIDKGFWLSFVAVAWIFWVLGRKPSWQGWRLWMGMQLTLFVGLAPLTLFWFEQVSWVSPLVNWVAIPVIGWLVVPGLLLWVCLLPLSAISDAVLWLINQVLDWGWQGLAYMSHFPVIAWQLSPVSFVFLWICVSVCCLPRPWPGRWLVAVLILPVVFPMRSAWTPTLKTGEFELTVLDVGQGLASVVRTRDHVMVYDVGNAFAGFDLGARVVAPYLAAKGISRVDQVVLSHMDKDHAGGIRGVTDSLTVNNIMFLPGKSLTKDLLPTKTINSIATSRCRAGDQWVWNEVNFKVIYPFSATAAEQRNLSCVIRVSSDIGSLLLTGDIESPMESDLVHSDRFSGDLLAEVLVVPHHGSKTSSTPKFINRVQPKHAIISSGWGNAFGHPHPAVVNRYRHREAQVWDTAEHGMLYFLWQDKTDLRIKYSRADRWSWRF